MSQLRSPTGDEPGQYADREAPDSDGQGSAAPALTPAPVPSNASMQHASLHAEAAVVPVMTIPPVTPAEPAPEVTIPPQGYPEGFAASTPADMLPASWQQPSEPAASWPPSSWSQPSWSQPSWSQPSPSSQMPRSQLVAQPMAQPMAQPGVQPGLQPGLQQPGAAPSSQSPWPVPSWPQQGSPQVYEQPAYPQAIGAQPPYPQHGYTPSPYPPSPYPPTAYPQPAYAPAGYSQVGYPPQAVAPAPPYPGPSPEASGYPQGGEQQGRRGPAVGAQVVEAAPAEPRNSVHTASAGPSALAYEIGQREERRSPAWRAIKWPLRHLIKGVYLTGNAAKNHRKAAIALTLIVLLLVIGAGAIYGYTHPSAPPDIGPAAVGAGSAAQDNTTPFTVVTGAQPPLAPGVLEWLHAYKTFNGYELWDSLSPTFQGQLSQAGVKSDQLQQSLLQEKSQGVGFDEFIYTGGYLSPDGLSHFTVEAVETQGDRKAILTWFFMTDSTGKIVIFHDLTPATQG